MPYKAVKLKIDYSVRDLCTEPYYNHPKGCPNYNKKVGCPPHTPVIENLLFFVWSNTFIIWNIFDFAGHCRKMKRNHPDWTQRQIECCLYWQSTARKQLENEIEKFSFEHPFESIIRNPEAIGVNVTATMSKIGEILEWPPKRIAYQVAIAGRKNDRRRT